MISYNCVDCGTETDSKVYRQGPRRCQACAKKARKEGRGERVNPYTGRMIREGIGVRELKANPGELLSLLEETPGLEIIITRYGKPSAKLVSLRGDKESVPWPERISLRGTWANLDDLSDEDFAEAKRIWEPKPDALV